MKLDLSPSHALALYSVLRDWSRNLSDDQVHDTEEESLVIDVMVGLRAEMLNSMPDVDSTAKSEAFEAWYAEQQKKVADLNDDFPSFADALASKDKSPRKRGGGKK